MKAMCMFFIASLFSIIIAGCISTDPEPINYGNNNCDYCKMTIVERSFGAELVTTKGKKFKFDSIECLAAFEITGAVAETNIHSMWVTDAANPETFINTKEASFIFSKDIKSPMSVGLIAYKSKQTADSLAASSLSGTIVNWEQLTKIVTLAWFNNK